jgi:MFS transporter, BCD family, chlorophyll transporter
MTGLSLRDVHVSAGETHILRGVDLEVPRGRIVAVVGPNGAGKSTLLDAISGVAPGMTGVVAIDGTTEQPKHGFPRAGVGRVFQGSPLPETMTVAEVIGLVAGATDETASVIARFGLAPHETTFVAELSTGMRRILDLAVASVGSPGVLLIDEPASGLAQSEIEHLAEVLLALREQMNAAVILVEHDAWLVKAVADEIIVLDAGEITARGTTAEVLSQTFVKAQTRVQHPLDERFADSLSEISASAVPAPPLVRRSLSTWTILRLGLREFAAGVGSVMILGVLSRVLRVELGVSLGAVTVILATYNLASPLGLPVGHRSDTRPIFGRRRVPYIIAGASITGLAVALAPHVAGRLAGGLSTSAVVLSVALFIAMGFGMYGSGTVFFALLSDLAPPEERGHVAKVIYLELLGGVFFGIVLTGLLVDERASGLTTLFALAGFSILLLTILAVVGMEPEGNDEVVASETHAAGLRTVIREALAIPQARLFFAYMVGSTVFFFLQQAVLQAFGGDVFGMTVQQTSGLTAMITAGTIVGMIVAGRPFAVQIGHQRMARWGIRIAIPLFVLLSYGAATTSLPITWLTLFALGVSLGIWNVAGLALMMGMATRARAAFFMGAWTVGHALADGIATASGGVIHAVARASGLGEPGAYASIFAIEAIGLVLCLPLLRKVDPDRFTAEAEALRARNVVPDEPDVAVSLP